MLTASPLCPYSTISYIPIPSSTAQIPFFPSSKMVFPVYYPHFSNASIILTHSISALSVADDFAARRLLRSPPVLDVMTWAVNGLSRSVWFLWLVSEIRRNEESEKQYSSWVTVTVSVKSARSSSEELLAGILIPGFRWVSIRKE